MVRHSLEASAECRENAFLPAPESRSTLVSSSPVPAEPTAHRFRSIPETRRWLLQARAGQRVWWRTGKIPSTLESCRPGDGPPLEESLTRHRNSGTRPDRRDASIRGRVEYLLGDVAVKPVPPDPRTCAVWRVFEAAPPWISSTLCERPTRAQGEN